mgnify:FL=1|tara:strand:+ start:1310 stop:1552 length:243 start_codon:yes stop_codon:yes gene_type:complete
MNLGRTALFYRSNPKARAKKAAYDSVFQKKKKQVKKRVECNAFNRKFGKKGDNMDCSHKNGTIVSEHRKKNRARGGAKKK